MSIAVVDASEAVDGYHDDLKMLMPSQAQGQLLVEAFAASAGGQRILFDPSALEIDEQNDVGGDDDAAVEQNIRIKQLISGKQQDGGRQDPHDAAHGQADAF